MDGHQIPTQYTRYVNHEGELTFHNEIAVFQSIVGERIVQYSFSMHGKQSRQLLILRPSAFTYLASLSTQHPNLLVVGVLCMPLMLS